MSADVLLKLSNEMEKRVKMRGCRAFYSVLALCNRIFVVKMSRFCRLLSNIINDSITLRH